MKVRCNGCFKMHEDEFDMCPYCGYFKGIAPREPYHLAPGTALNDRYTVGNVLGFGGFGITYKAWDKKLDSVVAIKEYYPSGIVNRPPGTNKLLLFSGRKKKEFEYGLVRFIDEARNMTKFNAHKNIVNVYEYFEENNTAYIVMEFLDGCALDEYMKDNGGKLSVDRSLEIIFNICNALKDVHESGIIHRDISPDNIFMLNDGTIKLIDFGAARFSSEEAKNFTIILKPGFAPPEQYEQVSDQGPKTDIYALGATLYYMITGVKPDESTNRKIKDILEEPINLDKEIPQHVSDSILKAMAIETHLRFESVEEFEKSIRKEIKVTSLKKEKRVKKTKRLIGILSLLIVLSGIALLFAANVEKKNADVTLDPAEITVWYVNDVGEAYDKEFQAVVAEFTKEYKDVKINLKGIASDKYYDELNAAIAAKKAPNLFVSTELSHNALEGMLDLSNVIYPDTDNKLYFLTYILAQSNPNGCYFLDDYDKQFPEHKQIPSSFNVPVIYVNTSKVTSFVGDEVKKFEDISKFINDKSKFIVNAEMQEIFKDVFETGLADNVIKGTKEQFINGEAGFYFSDTSEYFDVRRMVANNKGNYKMIPVISDDLLCSYGTYWSVSKAKENENAAATRFLAFLLSSNAQGRVIGKESVEWALPINEDAMETYAHYFSEFAFVKENIKDYIFKEQNAA